MKNYDSYKIGNFKTAESKVRLSKLLWKHLFQLGTASIDCYLEVCFIIRYSIQGL